MRWCIMVTATALALAAPAVALAAAPANDAFANAATVASLPASESVDLTEATLEAGEPSSICWPQARSVWFVFQPVADVVVSASSLGFADRFVTIYRQNGSGVGGLVHLACSFPWSPATASLQGGATYYVQVVAPPWSAAGLVTLEIAAIPPPANDAFLDATTMSSLPYVDSVDMRAATVETGEPTQPIIGPFTATTWYSFTPSVGGSYMVSTVGCCASLHNVAVYTGDAVDALRSVSGLRVCCNGFVFAAAAGATYMIQSGHRGVVSGNGQLGVRVEETPLPSVTAFWSPVDPSMYDTIGFSASTWDPAGIGIESIAWDFGDGTGATGGGATHRYAADGDYAVTLTGTSPDGRTASSTTTVMVRTHDVAITKLSTPHSARVNQARSITVAVANRRSAETVVVTLYRSRPGGGWDTVGQSTQLVPARASRTTAFAFSYTFTPEDGAVGKVSFRATASLAGARDALPGDNEAIASPTAVSA